MKELSIDVVFTDLGMLKLWNVGTSFSSIASFGSCQAHKVVIHKAKALPGVLFD